ncbi:MAG: hypothetical protein V2A34_03775 [Lentisphaerota bacterium]
MVYLFGIGIGLDIALSMPLVSLAAISQKGDEGDVLEMNMEVWMKPWMLFSCIVCLAGLCGAQPKADSSSGATAGKPLVIAVIPKTLDNPVFDHAKEGVKLVVKAIHKETLPVFVDSGFDVVTPQTLMDYKKCGRP